MIIKSGVMAIHNEEKYLPYSLGSLKDADLNELVVVLDRCTDRSSAMVTKFREMAQFPVRIINLTKRMWKWPTSEVFYAGFKEAIGDVIYAIAADLVFDPGIFRVAWENLDVCSFTYWDHDLYGGAFQRARGEWTNLYRRFMWYFYPRLTGKQDRSGVFAFRKKVYRRLRPGFRDTSSEDIRFQNRARALGYRFHFFHGYNNIHLRSGFSNKYRQAKAGKGKAEFGYPMWKVLGHSVLFWKPETFRAYLRAKVKK